MPVLQIPQGDPITHLLSVFPEAKPFIDYFNGHPGAGVIQIGAQMPVVMQHLLHEAPPPGPFFLMIRESSHHTDFDMVAIGLSRHNPSVTFAGREDGQGGITLRTHDQVWREVFAVGCEPLISYYRDRFEIQKPGKILQTPDPHLSTIGFCNPMGEEYPSYGVPILQRGDKRFSHQRTIGNGYELSSLRLTARFLPFPEADGKVEFDPANDVLELLSPQQVVVFAYRDLPAFYLALLADPSFSDGNLAIRVAMARETRNGVAYLREAQREFRYYADRFPPFAESRFDDLGPEIRRQILLLGSSDPLPDTLREFLDLSWLSLPPAFTRTLPRNLPDRFIRRWPQDF